MSGRDDAGITDFVDGATHQIRDSRPLWTCLYSKVQIQWPLFAKKSERKVLKQTCCFDSLPMARVCRSLRLSRVLAGVRHAQRLLVAILITHAPLLLSLLFAERIWCYSRVCGSHRVHCWHPEGYPWLALTSLHMPPCLSIFVVICSWKNTDGSVF